MGGYRRIELSAKQSQMWNSQLEALGYIIVLKTGPRGRREWVERTYEVLRDGQHMILIEGIHRSDQRTLLIAIEEESHAPEFFDKIVDSITAIPE